ncbi:kinase-like domain-containing protein [Microdochium bolleyi]|uniref:non-specific serine/threonine protein kinase n=1 Tax=Microdochium bolleyi TaxID=196109 RepID=A0A136IZW7_9PEZI|nr:kinase-like domain-containing protein [Microdochium bolleyi]
MPPFETLSDIVRDALVETETIDNQTTRHIRYEAGRSARQRRVRIEEQWRRSRQLGQGAWGTVYLETCVNPGFGSRLRAVKEIKKCVYNGEELDYGRELEAIFKFSHARYNHCFVAAEGWYEEQDRVYILMEYCELGDLSALATKPLPEAEVQHIATQVLEGLVYMHSNQFVHRDLKPSNVMVINAAPEWFVKIADFGISKRRHAEVTTLHTMHIGTFGYAAPEIFGFCEDHQADSYSFTVDTWSLGAMVYKLCAFRLPFSDLGQLARYTTGTFELPISHLETEKLSETATNFISTLLSPTPDARPSAVSAQLHAWISHPAADTKRTETQMNKKKPSDSLVLCAAPSISTREAAGDRNETISVVGTGEYQPPYAESVMNISMSSSQSRDPVDFTTRQSTHQTSNAVPQPQLGGRQEFTDRAGDPEPVGVGESSVFVVGHNAAPQTAQNAAKNYRQHGALVGQHQATLAHNLQSASVSTVAGSIEPSSVRPGITHAPRLYESDMDSTDAADQMDDPDDWYPSLIMSNLYETVGSSCH